MDSVDARRLAQTELSLKGILDASPVGIIVFDEEARVIFSNPLAERLFGKAAGDMRDLKCGDFIGCAHRHAHPQGCGNTRTCTTCPLHCGIRTLFRDVPDENALEGEALITRESDLPAIWVKFKVSHIALNGGSAAVMAIDDITGQKRNEEKLRDALTELSVIHEHAPIAMMLMDPQRRVRKVNGFAARFARRAAHEMIGMTGGEALRCLHHLDDPRGCGFGPACADCRVRQAVVETFESHTGKPEVEAWLPFPKGESHEQRCLLISTAYLKTDVIERVLVCAQDITGRKLAEAAMRESEERFSKAFRSSPASLVITDIDTALFIDVNACWMRLLGYCREELIGRTSMQVDIWDDPGERERLVAILREKGSFREEPIILKSKSGQKIYARWSAEAISLGGQRVMLSLIYDETERREVENERKITIELLSRINQAGSLPLLISQVTDLMKEWSGCDAVGVRLQDGEDYPYYETRGLPADFVKAENRLCATDPDGERIRDSQGNAVLECMCGNVIRGRFDPEQPFFTANGSFWTNSTTDLLASTDEADRQARTRNRCHGEGYESVALIPLRYEGRNLGLLQFNDRRRDRFSEARIALLERLAANLISGIAQRLTAESLARSEEQLRTIADFTYDWEYWIGPDQRLIWISPSCHRVTGYTATEFMADENLLERIIHKMDALLFMQHLAQVRGVENRTGHLDFRITHKSGRTRWINHHCIAIRRPDGTLLGRRVSNRDITDRKRMEQMLQESETQFRTLVEGAPDAIFVHDLNCRFVYLNEAALHLFGAQTADQLLGTTILERFHPDFHQAVRERIRTLHKENIKLPRRERICLRLDGSAVPVEVSAVPISVEGQHRSLVFVQDISERKQIEVRLQQAQKLEAIGTLAGGIAHDFNNILFPISGMSEMLLEDFEAGSLHYDNIALIHDAALRAKGLVAQILSFSRQAEHKKIPLQIQHVLKEVGKLARATIPSNIVIRQNIQSDCGPVLADPTNVHQIAMNLITNALHAVEAKGGRIGIELSQTVVAKDDALGSSLVPGPCALLTVSDTGHGIDAEVLPRIFDPYFTTKSQDKGTGLGLAVVYGIVKDHDGDIRVCSEVGQGTTFKVYLPLIPRNREPERALDEQSGYPMGTERILLVDDEEPILRMERQMLERLGYRVTTHTSSRQALQAFKANPAACDLVITDMAMPGMTGDQLAERLVEVRPDIPVILCTGFSEKVFIPDAVAPAIKGFLMKPIARGDLANLIRKILDEGVGG
jgi:PAS domain S-box-containing protein